MEVSKKNTYGEQDNICALSNMPNKTDYISLTLNFT